MNKGILYIMSAPCGLIKIGKTDNFQRRMHTIERDGYNNISGWKREFGIEVDNYSEKEYKIIN